MEAGACSLQAIYLCIYLTGHCKYAEAKLPLVTIAQVSLIRFHTDSTYLTLKLNSIELSPYTKLGTQWIVLSSEHSTDVSKNLANVLAYRGKSSPRNNSNKLVSLSCKSTHRPIQCAVPGIMMGISASESATFPSL